MALREIVKKGDDVLVKKCREVVKFDDRLAMLIDDMIDTLRDSGGVGLAAPQVGMLRRVVVIEIDEEQGVIELVNPEIIETSGKQVGLEGCLSLPGQWGISSRPYRVTVKAQDRNGKEFTIKGEGLLARAFCHELDHLDGILYDTRVERMLFPEEIEKLNAGELDLSDECYIEE
ncbi:MAG: peptide deformylase [Ruminococcus sp.]|jgi:peptide deformylase|nr:peptide deformylase [Ruminococcus sp.]